MKMNQKGMTLLEIMIVLAILGGIATLVVTQVVGQLDKAKAKQAKILMSNLSNALDMYYTDCGSYPQDLNGLIQKGGDCRNWGPQPYIKQKQVPRDPWSREFTYESEGSSYVLLSYGKDGREGGDGLDEDISSEEL